MIRGESKKSDKRGLLRRKGNREPGVFSLCYKKVRFFFLRKGGKKKSRGFQSLFKNDCEGEES